MNKQCVENIPIKQPVEGFKGRFVHSEKMTIAFWNIEQNKQLSEHSHHHEQIIYVQKGEFEITINGKTTVMKENDCMVIPSNMPHSGRSLTYCEIIDMFSPPREDFK